jgi:hypothetical protein
MLKHIAIWLLAELLTIVAAPAYYNADAYRDSIAAQMEEISRWYGENEVSRMKAGADEMYIALVRRTGFAEFVKGLASPSTPTPALARATNQNVPHLMSRVATGMSEYWPALLLSIYQVCLRAIHAWIWFLYLIPFLVAVIFDGIMARKVKLTTFSYSSPTVYNAAWHMIIFTMAVAVFLLTASLHIHVFFFPSAVAIVGLLIRLLISNAQASL